ncbi:3'-5' exonuclease [Anaerofustis stercorihominis]|uniref:3'-5' exonuclease n=1 Tax=Anaerofustis stercorihominis TaxID=214853 RepID=UPI001105F629|nr:3'-5' exonuclease [Anaerofustis stercorihominis]
MNYLKYREHKGKEYFDFPNDYCVIDIETTGLDSEYNEIIEIGALKIRATKISDEFSILVKPQKETISEQIQELTGIDNEMIKDAANIKDAILKFNDFVGKDILVGQNVNFDINFLYDNYEKNTNFYLSNDYVDLLKISRKISPEFENHKLETILKKLNIQRDQKHRALSDCIDTYHCFEKYRNIILEQYGDINMYKMIFNL